MEGGEAPPVVMRPRTLSLKQLHDCDADHLIDIREPMAYASGHLPGSMSLPVNMLPAFAGWFIEEGQSLELETDIVEGMQFENGYLSPYMVNKPENMSTAIK